MWLLLSISVLKPVFWELKALQISSKPVEQREMTTQELKQIVHFNHKNIFNRAIGSAQYVLKKKHGILESDMVLLLRSKVLRVLLYLRRSPSCMESW